MSAARAVLLASPLLATIGHAASTQVDVFSANEALQPCRDAAEGIVPETDNDVALQGACVGRLQALIALAPHLRAGFRSCPPDALSPGDALSVILQFVEDRPRIGEREFWDVGVHAFRSTWPCDESVTQD